MSPAFARLLAIPFALPAFGLGALEKLWEGPLPVLSATPVAHGTSSRDSSWPRSGTTRRTRPAGRRSAPRRNTSARAMPCDVRPSRSV